MRVGREQMLSRDCLAKIKKLLKAYPRGLSITSISHKLNLNRNSASRHLDVLLITGHLEMQTIGASKVFRLTQRVPISSLLSFSSDLILVMDLDGNIIQVNDNFLDFFGIEKESFWKKDPQAAVTGILQKLNVLRDINTPAEIKASRETSFILNDRSVHLKLNLLPTVFDDGQKGITIIMEDLTELRHLEEIDAFLASIVTSSNDAIIGKTLEGKIVSWNDGAQRIYGYSADEIIGRNIAELTPSGYEEELESILRKVQNGERVHHFATRRKTKGGTIIDVSVTISPIRDKADRIIGASTIARDITETIRTGRDLLIRNTALDRVASGVILTDTTNRIFYANPAFLQLSAAGDPANILGRRFDECWRGTDAGSAPFQGMYEGLHETGTWFGEIRLQKMDGGAADLQIYASVIPDLSGAVLCTMTYCTDITDHKRVERDLLTSQEQMRHIIEFLPDPTFIIDDKGMVIAWNKAMVEITGKKAEEMLGKGEYAYALPFYGEGREVLIDLIGEPAEKIYARYPKARISNQNIFAEVYAPQLPSGGRYLWAKASPFFNSDGKRIGAIESIRDITDWKQIENARESALQRREAMVHERPTGGNRRNVNLTEDPGSGKTPPRIATTLHAAVLEATDLVFILNSDGRILFANHSAEMLIENAIGKITGRSILSFIADEYRIPMLKIFSGSSRNPETLAISLNTPAGEQPVVGSISLFNESAESPRQILLIFQKRPDRP